MKMIDFWLGLPPIWSDNELNRSRYIRKITRPANVSLFTSYVFRKLSATLKHLFYWN